MKMYKVTFAIRSYMDTDTPGVIKVIRKNVSEKLFCSPQEAMEDYLKGLANPFAHDVKIESVEV